MKSITDRQRERERKQSVEHKVTKKQQIWGSGLTRDFSTGNVGKARPNSRAFRDSRRCYNFPLFLDLELILPSEEMRYQRPGSRNPQKYESGVKYLTKNHSFRK